jgi:tRNA G46 methylase TrmB
MTISEKEITNLNARTNQLVLDTLTKQLNTSAENAVIGGCNFYIKRRERFCKRKKTVGSEFCSMHRAKDMPITLVHADSSSATLTGTRYTPSVLNAVTIDGRKSNINRPLKRMLNPFVIRNSIAINLDDLYKDPLRPFVLDIGSAKGNYLKFLRLKNHKNIKNQPWNNQMFNFLGIELFKPLVDQSNLIKYDDLHYIHGNILNCLEDLKLKNLQIVTILFPDPWACGTKNTKNKKKRLMSEEFAVRLGKVMKPGGMVYFASDWHELALDIRQCLLGSGMFSIPTLEASDNLNNDNSFDNILNKKSGEAVNSICCDYPYIPTITASELSSQVPNDANQLIDIQKSFEKPVQNSNELWLNGIPFQGGMTERDLVCETQWRSVYRLILTRNCQ